MKKLLMMTGTMAEKGHRDSLKISLREIARSRECNVKTRDCNVKHEIATRKVAVGT